ncbi:MULTISPECIES: cache domain-containing protein [Psychrilyobacter]|nr:MULTISPECIES: cache domain-containing protein [Psychrilyobacter]MCS5421798.1 cache domain-containing protein [Psychrilyobacter sp. S5]NDI77030.1 diguanylate cyclase [Psychrilyobacter piezotolerans]
MQDLKKIGRYFRFTTLFILIIAILVMGGLWVYTSYSTFYRESGQLKEEYIASQKDLIQNEVNKVIDEIEHHKSKTEEKLRESIRERGYEAYDIVINIYERNKNKKSKKEIEQIIAETFSGVTFNKGRGYYFGGRVQDVTLLFGDRPQIQGKKVLDYRSPEGKYIFRDIVQILTSEGEGFYEYMWEHPGDIGNSHRKVSFFKLVEPLNIWIGTGEYYEDFQYEQQQEILERISRVSFGRDGYIFVSNFNGLNLTTGDKKQSQLIGTNEWELEDFRGVKIVQELAKAAKKKDGGFVYYKWHKPSKNQPVDKITFVKGVSGWNWMVGTGVYLDDINDAIVFKRKILKERIIEHIAGISYIIFFLGSLALLLELHVLKRIKSIIKYEENVSEILLNLSMDGIYLENDRGEILDCNESIHRMLGYTKEELLNLSLADLMAENQRKGFSVERGVDLKNSHREVMIKKKDGTLLSAEISTSALELEDEKRQITFLRDITKRKGMEKNLKELSIRDGLTQLYNRRYIFKKLKSEVEKSNENGLPLSISLIDIDHFKKINDVFGHMMGDEVLKKIAVALQENLRDEDHIGRYGGEEFLIILPNTKSEEALKIIERIKTIINQLRWKDDKLAVSFSGGIIEKNSKTSYTKLEEMVDEVDKLLYRAKNNGRNRIEIQK